MERDELLILPFDHRGSLLEKLLGVKGRQPNEAETEAVKDLKRVVYDGFKLSFTAMGVPMRKTAILVDEQFGAEILEDARKDGITTACPTEKSGQEEFDFEYADWKEHIEKTNPAYAKVLVRLNPEGDVESNSRQLARLKELNDYLKETGRGFLFELLVPATKEQLEKAGGDKGKYDSEQRPALMVKAMAEIQKRGIEPDVWKLEGVDLPEDARALVAQAKAGGRRAGIITLGRGESAEKVREWLKVGAGIGGIIGFAVGRTVFWDAIKGYRERTLSRQQAVEMVARNYGSLVALWEEGKKKRQQDPQAA
ncbi:DUF2090 domain-containing protein [Candidatus Micrarchaeota archaeon]|nr:DUF2090 domain-containing protein [Candidatus Micrarchaeota archaeon]